MKLLFDENLPERLKDDLTTHQISTVKDEGWGSIKNGNLLRLMIAAGFDALITCDRRLCYQQNLNKYPIPIIILRAKRNEYDNLRLLVPELKALLRSNLKPGPHELTLTLN
jgi:predicted nuclease of predicted toxin-antitoxin system